MTEEERDMDLEDLFRNKLEDNEVEAGSDLSARFMRRLGQREFFRFNLLRFNIYYLTAALTALMITVVILLSDSADESKEINPAAVMELKAGEADNNAAEPGSEREADEKGSAGSIVELSSSEIREQAPEETAAAISRETAIRHSNTRTEDINVSTIVKEEGPATPVTVTLPVIGTTVTSGCVPLQVSFSSNAGEDCSTEWEFGDGGVSGDRNPDYIYDLPGKYSVILSVTDSRGRTYSANSVIEVWERPKAAFEIRRDDPWNEGDKVAFINMSTGAVNYLWDFGDGTCSALSDPSYRYKQPGTYIVSLLALSSEGCADSVTVSDLFTDTGMYLRFPNAFVPNKEGPTGGYYNIRTDEESQVFHPVASGIAEYNLKIYSKAGLLVFESTETAMGWDGYYRGELCAPGVYVWKVRGTYRNGRTFIMAGDVTLLNY